MTEDEYELNMSIAPGSWPCGEDPLQLAEEAVREFPGSAKLWFLRGNVLSFCLSGYSPSLKQHCQGYSLADIADAYRRATELDPDFLEAWDVRSRFCKATGDDAGAEKCSLEVARLRALQPATKFAPNEVVRILQQPTGRSEFIGELATIAFPDDPGAEYIQKYYPGYTAPREGEIFYFLVIYRHEGLAVFEQLFPESHLETVGEFDGLNCEDEPVDLAAARGAALALRFARPYLCQTKSIGPWTPGISESEAHLVAHLPLRTIAAGCRDPGHERAGAYAEIFNRQILKSVLTRGG